MRHSLTKRLTDYANEPRSLWLLGFISFIESIFFPIPTDIFLITYLVARAGRGWILSTTVTVLASVLGGLASYFIGFFFFEAIGVHIISAFNLEASVARLGDLFTQHSFLAMFTASFSPVPYKVFTLGAGLFEVPLLPFIGASLLGRGLRFGAEGYAIALLGPHVAKAVTRYTNVITIAIVIITIAVLFLV